MKYICGDLIVGYDEKTGCLSSLSTTRQDFLYRDCSFFGLRLRHHDGFVRVLFSKDMTYQGCKEGGYLYTHPLVDVLLFLSFSQDGLRSRLRVINHTDAVIEFVELSSFSIFPRLCDEANGRGAIFLPYNEGCLITNMARRQSSPFPYAEVDYPSVSKAFVFPNMMSSQLIGYLKDGEGLLLMAEDEGRGCKHIDVRPEGNRLVMMIRSFTGADYGKDYEMPFWMRLSSFQGGWKQGASLYRKWFYSHLPQGLKPFCERNDIPLWQKQSPIVVVFPLRGRYDTDKMEPNGLYPYEKALPILQKIQNQAQSPVLALLMHYESTAPWCPPEYWPPLGGEQAFSSFVDDIHRMGSYVGLYASGFGYTLQSRLIPSYDRRKDFVKQDIARAACSNSDGTIASTICKAQREGVDLCPASPLSQRLFCEGLQPLLHSGIDYLQALDQNHGGNSYFCYSDQHGHPPVPGEWMVQAVRKTLESLQKPPGVALGCETAAAEPYLDLLTFSDNRFELNYYLGEPIPLYSFLYHEFVHNFMGNQICESLLSHPLNYPYRLAYSLLAGDALTVVMTDKGFVDAWCRNEKLDKTIVLKCLRSFNAWRRGLFGSYLKWGKMVFEDTFTGYKNVAFTQEDGTQFLMPAVLSETYALNKKRIQFLVNYTDKTQNVCFSQQHKIYPKPDSFTFSEQKEITIPAFSVVAVEQNDD